MTDDGLGDRLQSLLRASQAVTSQLDLPVVLRLIVEEAVRLVDARYGALGVITPDGQSLEQFIHVGVDADTAARIGSLPRGHGLLGALIRDPEPIRLDDLQQDARSEGYPAAHPPMHSFLGVPIHVRDAIFGNLYLTEKRSGRFSDQDTEIVTGLAAAAGVAIANARLFDETQRRQRWAQASAEIMSSLVAGTTEEALDLLAERVLDLADADLTCVVVPRADDDLVIAAAAGVNADSLPQSVYSRSESLVGDVLATGEATVATQAIRRILVPHVDPALGSTLLVPLEGRDGVRGVLVASRLALRQHFTAGELATAVEFAGHASVALELGQARREASQFALLEDRARIARDLHDHVIQRLFAAGLGLEATLGRIDDPSVVRDIAREVDALDAAIAEIRTAIFAFSAPRSPSGPGLRHRVIDMIGELGHLFPQSPRLTFSGALDLVADDTLADDVVATVREGLSNAARHAQARQVDVSISLVDSRVIVTVADDGEGVASDASFRGLNNLRDRAERRGGALDLLPRAPRGTLLRWSAPRPEPIDQRKERA